MIALIVLLPLIIAAVAIALLRGQKAAKSKYLAIAASAVSLALMLAVSQGQWSATWFGTGNLEIGVSVSVTPLSYILLAVVLGIGLLVFVYSAAFMDRLSEQRRYYIEMLVFEASMAAFVVSGNFILMFIAWEMMSMTSYLLIGFWNAREPANRAARKAITIVLIGDVAFLAAIALLWSIFGTLQFSQIIPLLASVAGPRLYVATLLLLIAVFTKSAQFPFHEWLIGAMEGPTPVSAYLHSSTMVKAGVLMVILLYPVFSAPSVSLIIMVFGVVTVVVASLAAAREMHVKKVIAYSTVQELSLMLIAISAGAVVAGIYFFLIQSFYKALLFFISGVAMKSSDSEQLDKEAGMRTSRMAFVSALFGALSLAGFIPFSGFFANGAIMTSLSSNLVLYAVLSAVGLLTSFYIFRWLSYLSRSTKRKPLQAGYSSQPNSMLYPAAVLAIATIAASALFFYFPGILGSSVQSGRYTLTIRTTDAALLIALSAIGAILAYAVYYKGLIGTKQHPAYNLARTGPAVNWLYEALASMLLGLAEGVAAFEAFVNSGFDRIGRLTVASGYAIRMATTGSINAYILILLLGTAGVAVSFYYFVII